MTNKIVVYVYTDIETYIGICLDNDSFCVSLLDKTKKQGFSKMGKLHFHFGEQYAINKKKEKNGVCLADAYL